MAVYLGTPTDYAQVSDVPEDKLLTPGADGRYHVHGGQQITVVTAAPLPSGWTRFYLRWIPTVSPEPVAGARLTRPIGATYTFSVSALNDAPTRFIFELVAVKPDPERPNKLLFGDVVVKTQFQTPRIPYSAFDTTGAATTVGSYSFLMPDTDSAVEDATTAVETYGEMRKAATMLAVNETDGDGFDQSAALDTVQVGDVLQWGQGRTCWTRYKVTSAPEPAEGSSVRSSA